jgi:hypothetical protein
VSMKSKSKRPVDRMLDTDAHGDEHFRDATAVVADLKGRRSAGDIEAIVRHPCQSHGLAQTTRSCGQEAWCGPRWQAAIDRHQVRAGNGFEGAQQHTAGKPFGLTANIHAKVAAVDAVDIRMSSGTKENGVPRGGTAMRVGRWVRRIIVRTKISLRLNDSACRDAGLAAVDQELSEQTRSNEVGRVLKKAAREKLAFPGLKIEISTPRTKTRPRGPRTWGTQVLL